MANERKGYGPPNQERMQSCNPRRQLYQNPICLCLVNREVYQLLEVSQLIRGLGLACSPKWPRLSREQSTSRDKRICFHGPLVAVAVLCRYQILHNNNDVPTHAEESAR